MLRTWVTFQEKKMLLDVVNKFDVHITNFSLQKFEALTPDSLIWYFSADKQNYCLYAEDYIPSLEHVEQAIAKNLPEWLAEDEFKLVKVKQALEWDQSSPASGATVYNPPEDTSKFMEYAYPSGHDFVFLAKSIH